MNNITTKVAILSLFSFFNTTTQAENLFQHVIPGRILNYPVDHGSHPEFPIEWWYITGYLEKKENQEPNLLKMGFQITFFRAGIKKKSDSSKTEISPWHSDSVLIAHTAITDELKMTYCSSELSERTVVDIAETKTKMLSVQLRSATLREVGSTFEASFKCKNHHLKLVFTPEKPLVLHGDQGYVAKGPEKGNASYYVSYPRMSVKGVSSVFAENTESMSKEPVSKNSAVVTGSAWFDHEIVSAPVDQKDIGWDWFALQFSDNSELMVYQLRNPDGSKSPYSRGTYITTSGDKINLGAKDCVLKRKKTWTSPKTATKYTIGWQIRCNSEQLKSDVEVAATLPEQEFLAGNATGKRYWEGRVKSVGTLNDVKVTGNGYLEMVGYDR
jgi:predicted secreted hydrolase